MTTSQPHLVNDGVAFTVDVDYVKHNCVISTDALTKLSEMGAGDADLLQTYSAYEANINGIARRLVAAGVPSSPLWLHARNFNDAVHRRPQ